MEAALHVGVGGIQLGENRRFIPALCRRKTGGHHGPADLPALVALVIDVVVQRDRAHDQNIVRAVPRHFSTRTQRSIRDI